MNDKPDFLNLGRKYGKNLTDGVLQKAGNIRKSHSAEDAVLFLIGVKDGITIDQYISNDFDSDINIKTNNHGDTYINTSR